MKPTMLALAFALLLPTVACSTATKAPAHHAPAARASEPSYVVGGHVQGLHGIGLSLRISNGDEVKVDDDGKFVFPTWATEGSSYDVVVAREPISPVQSCAVERGKGRVEGKNAMDILVTCKDASFDDLPSDVPSVALHTLR